MKRGLSYILLFLPIAFCIGGVVTFGQSPHKQSNADKTIISEDTVNNTSIKEGYVSVKQETIMVERNGKVIASVELSEPVMVAMAEKKEEWGYFQFPDIVMEEGKLIVGWQMKEDSHKAYGKGGGGALMSRDNGVTWEPLDHSYFTLNNKSFHLNNGDVIQLYTPQSKDIRSYDKFPKYVYSDSLSKINYYLESELPDDLRGMYLTTLDGKTGKTKRIHAEIDNKGFLRKSIDGLVPVVWWGEIKELNDGVLVAGIYPSYYQRKDGSVDYGSVTFYRSEDKGYHWQAIGKIPYLINNELDETRLYDELRGFSEPAFEILKDGTYLCVMRTGHNTPMYRTFSYDSGKSWSEPEPFTPNGVKPRLMLLNNGILALVSGRPGVQVRFNIDGDGKSWTEPIEMLPTSNEKWESAIWNISCGYTSLLKVNENTFYLVYSDFRTKDENGEKRKAIMFRKIEVKKQ